MSKYPHSYAVVASNGEHIELSTVTASSEHLRRLWFRAMLNRENGSYFPAHVMPITQMVIRPLFL